MKKTLIFTFSFLAVLAVAVLAYKNSSKSFLAKKENNSIIIHNITEEHFPDIAITCNINKKTYHTPYKFIPGKGSIKLAAHDFNDDEGNKLSSVQNIDDIEITGGDSLIDESVNEEVLIK